MSFSRDPLLRSDRQLRTELDEEFEFHLEMVTRELLAQGLSETEAREEAERRFGLQRKHFEACRRIGQQRRNTAARRAWWSDLRIDLRLALRTALRTPGNSLFVTATLGLVIGATTLIFSLLDGVALQPLPFPEPDRLVAVWESDRETGRQQWVSAPNFLDWQSETRSFESMAAYSWTSVTTSGATTPERLTAATVTPEFFEVLGARAATGATFSTSDVKEHGEHLAVLGHSFWQSRLGGDEAIVGTTLELDRELYQVLGVMPPGMDFPGDVDLWIPLVLEPKGEGRGARWLVSVARLTPSASLDAANADLNGVALALEELYPDSNRQGGARAVSLREDYLGTAAAPLWILFGAVILVLSIGILNVIGLEAARSAARRRELGVRAAIGAGRGRIVRQLVTESLLLAAAGGILGLALAKLGLLAVKSVLPVSVPRVDAVAIDQRVLIFMAAVTFLTGVSCGLWPALRFTSANVVGLLRAGGEAPGRKLFGRRALVVVETALSIVLVIAATLLLRSLWEISRVELGFEPEHVLTFRVGLPESEYPEPEQQSRFFEELADRLGTLPGVEAVGLNPWLPPDSGWFFSYRPPDLVDESARQPTASFRFVNDEYFEALEIAVEGRAFTSFDRTGSEPVIIINRELADRHFPDGALGHQMVVGYGNPDDADIARKIVGIAGNTRQMGPSGGLVPAIYVPHTQLSFDTMTVAMKTRGAPETLIEAARAELGALDSKLAAERPEAMTTRIEHSIGRRQFLFDLLTAFAGIALLLAVIGVYGVVSQLVTQRRYELGVRIALGADRGSIAGWVLARGLVLAVAGVLLGLLAAAGATRALSSMLFEVSPTDPLTFLVAALVLLACAGVACWLPARRASKIDALSLLRSE